MPNLLAMSFEGELAPSFDLRCLHPGRTPPDGWGIGYYPGGEPSATVLKEPAPPTGSIRSELVKAWEHLESSLFVVHVRTATWGAPTGANTQPFVRAWGRRDWLFAHSGSLRERPVLQRRPAFEPVGSTDTEAVLCELLGRIADQGWRSLADADLDRLRHWYEQLGAFGSLTSVLTDGQDLAVYADLDPGSGGIWLREVRPPASALRLSDDDLVVDLAGRGPSNRKGIICCTEPLALEPPPGHAPEPGDAAERARAAEAAGAWRRIPPGHLLVIRQGVVRAVVSPAAPPEAQLAAPAFMPRLRSAHPRRAEPKRLEISHRTVYRYSQPVERSMHVFRLTPVHDRVQALVRSQIACSVPGKTRDYDDVFGNVTRRMVVETPFQEMVLDATSTVDVLDSDPLSYKPLRARSQIPLVWMPWQRTVLAPFLLPPELPESQLLELSDYGMSFVERNDFDLLETLLDLNDTIHHEYQYAQGTTTLATTPFDTYTERRGVCQDFTNLFICLARLLGVPARYVCGYLYTGPKHANAAMAEASHAWAQVYLPEVGWRGFDPTNGVLTQTDHVRVSVGRGYFDATPTSGTIYVGGGDETLTVDVRVNRVE